MKCDACEISVEAAIDAVIGAGRHAAARGWVPATSGNFSVRSGDRIAITRTGCDKGSLTPDEVALVSLADPRPDDLSAEAPLHFARYAADPSVGAVFHVHMPSAALLARLHVNSRELVLQGWELQKCFVGVSSHLTPVRVPIVPNDQDTDALARAAEQELRVPGAGDTAPGYLIAGHGVNSWGRTPREAWRHLEAFDALLSLQLHWLEMSS